MIGVEEEPGLRYGYFNLPSVVNYKFFFTNILTAILVYSQLTTFFIDYRLGIIKAQTLSKIIKFNVTYYFL